MEWIIGVGVAAILGFVVWKFVRSSTLPRVGEEAPAFSLPDQDGETRQLGDFRGRWLALYFYPRDDTPGCVQQACRFRDDWRTLEAMGADVVGVSVDDVRSHGAFAKRYSLMFRLLADARGAVAARYGSLYDLVVFKVAKRNTFLIDPRGRIAKIYAPASASTNSQEVIADLHRLRTDAREPAAH
jgi:peroxiredoxin Q/BCP